MIQLNQSNEMKIKINEENENTNSFNYERYLKEIDKNHPIFSPSIRPKIKKKINTESNILELMRKMISFH